MEQIFINSEKSDIFVPASCYILRKNLKRLKFFVHSPEKDESTCMSFTVFGLYQENKAVAETRSKSA